MTPADIVIAGAGVATAILAAWALFASYNTFRASYQPLVRAVWSRRPDGLILKNVGRGPALSVTVAMHPAENETALVGDVDVVEPLGEPKAPTFDESSRIGRVAISTRRTLMVGQTYSVFYQDSAGAWHQTDFTVRLGGFETKLRGPCGIWRLRPVPAWVKARGQMAADELPV